MGLVMVEGWWQDAQKVLKDVGKGAVAGAVAGAKAKAKGLLPSEYICSVLEGCLPRNAENGATGDTNAPDTDHTHFPE